jgi:diphosphomevalonate decarboxylase
MDKATAVAHPNIALIKYWGKVDEALNLPANPSLSMNLASLTTVTTVDFRPALPDDIVVVDGQQAEGRVRDRVVAHLDRVRASASIGERARVSSRSDFPAGTGLASSASAFAALSLAATRAAGLDLGEAELSRLARLGSGSACRSVPAGFSLWEGDTDKTSFARQVAPQEHWDLCDVIAIVSRQQKTVSSYDGHALAPTSPFHRARLASVSKLLSAVWTGILERDLEAVGQAVEVDALAMHGVMMTSKPSLLYWLPGTVAVLRAVRSWRDAGLSIYHTMDAGPNVHCFCRAADAKEAERRLRNLECVLDVLVSGPGDGARLVDYHLF